MAAPTLHLYRLRECRRALGLSQADLARHAQVSRSTVARLEAGVMNCTLKTLLALADALHVRPERLLQPPTPCATLSRDAL